MNYWKKILSNYVKINRQILGLFQGNIPQLFEGNVQNYSGAALENYRKLYSEQPVTGPLFTAGGLSPGRRVSVTSAFTVRLRVVVTLRSQPCLN
jgi:hypothetical protein